MSPPSPPSGGGGWSAHPFPPLHMVYILNTPLKENKRCLVALRDIFGLGEPLIHQICDQLGISPRCKCNQLNAQQYDQLIRCISQNYCTGMELRVLVASNKKRYVSISSFRGFRLISALPSRGQRTHGNAQTARRCSTPMVAARGKRGK